MSKKRYRIDKTCLNCKHVVENKFCPNCGQENTDTRKTFHHLFLHFFEDLTHYENAFWRTIKNLLFRPASLTKEYLSGKRLSYLAPVRLYIFISFVTFFLIAISPNKEDKLIKSENGKNTIETERKDNFTFKETDNNEVLKNKDSIVDRYDKTADSIEKVEKENEKFALAQLKIKELKIEELKKNGIITNAESDSIKNLLKTIKKNNEKGFMNFGYKTIKELDSIQQSLPEKDKMNALSYWVQKKSILVKQNNTEEEIIEKGKESAIHNFPKVLLIYMPLFAFFLWLFHNKKRWYYFDHGIFTLHYFSFLLLMTLLSFLLSEILSLFGTSFFIKLLEGIIDFVTIVWMFYYFFPAHHRFYGETRWVSFFKSVSLFFINMFFILLILVLFFIYTLVSIH
jgi:hypothetical protein